MIARVNVERHFLRSKGARNDVGKHRGHLRDIHVPLVFDSRAYLVGQLAGDLGSVDALDVVVEALPLGDPGPRRVGQGDEALVNLARAALDGFGVVLEVQEVFAVGAAFVSESLLADSRDQSLEKPQCSPGSNLVAGGRKERGETYAGGHDDGAHHAGAQVAVLARWHEVVSHVGECPFPGVSNSLRVR